MKHYFQTEKPDLAVIQKRLLFWFKEHEYEVDSAEDDGYYLIQAKKTGKLRTLTGTNIAFQIKLYPSDEPNEFIFESGTGKWTQNIAGAGITAIFTGGITLLTGIAGAAWIKKIERDIIDFMEDTLKFRKLKTVDDKGVVIDAPPTVVQDSPKLASQPSIQPEKQIAVMLTPKQKAENKIKEQAKKLEDAHNGDILSDDEYAQKKAELSLKDAEYEIEFLVEEQVGKLTKALESGILTQEEYDSKVSNLKTSVKEGYKKEKKKRESEEQINKLKAALDSGILTQEEYDTKISALE